MDERHWWIAGKIQETFRIGGYDNPTLLEDFMTEETTLNKINRFLKAGGPCRLFFTCAKAESGVLSTRELNVTGTLAALKDVDLDKVNILYFLRNRVDKDVDTVRYERDIFCGELKHNTIETLVTLLSDVYNPLIKAQKEWGECNMEGQTNLSHSMDKFLTALNESTASMHHSKQLMLKQPENIVLNDFKQHRAAALDAQLIGQYEELVTDWINTIETMLNDTSDERFMDPNAGPLSELERWRRRQRLLTSITEQLKSKECKAVIGVLITAKSRLLKKWKNVDAQITDAMNDTKDKVKYLESLRRHFDQLYQDATPASIINNAIPGIVNSVRQMDSISRYYARTGFLGIVFTKITNQLVLACKEYIKNCTITAYDGDELWVRIKEEIRNRDSLPLVDPQQRLLRNQVEAKIKQQGALTRGKTKEGKDLGLQDDSLYGRLKACLTLQGYYRETLRSLRDSLGQTNNMSHFPSLSSVGGPGSFTTRSKPSNASRSGPSVSPKKGISSLMTNDAGHGVSIADEDAIMSHMDSFCNRIRQLIDVINTLAQYNKLATSTIGVPKPRKEDLVIDDEDSDEYKYRKFRENKANKLEYDDDDDGNQRLAGTIAIPSPERSGLRAIKEDEENQEDNISEIEELEEKKTKTPAPVDNGDDVFESVNNNKGLNENELGVLRRYFPEDEEEEGPSISAIISQHLQQMTQAMSDNVTTKTMLDVESKDKDRFEDYYTNFAQICTDLETFLAAYLHAIFISKTKTQQALDTITRFTPVQNRPGIRACISEKFVEIFNWYESDLEEVHQIYEAHKNNPQLVRNAPPVAGAIHWSRQLLKRIEDPMKIFRDNKAVNQLGDFGRIVRIYNKLATALVTFESLWFTQWKNRIDHARNGLRATLFVHHPTTGEIVVNADERVLELIHEAKWLTRLGIQIPDAAIAIMQQESRFKGYKSHLELVLNEYKEVCEAIPEPLQKLFAAHMDHVEQQLQPGLSTLAWNSMNIDAFLHQIHSATQKLMTMEAKVAEIMEEQVFSTLDEISSFYLFDIDEAFARSWPPEEFREVMLRGAQDRSRTLQEMVKTVADGLQKVANTLALRKEYDLTSMRGEMHSKLIGYKRRQTIREPQRRPSSSPSLIPNMNDHHGKSKKMALMMDEEEVAREKQKAMEEEHYVAELIAHYKDEVYDAVLSATYKSLAALAESTGCDGEVIRVISSMSNASSDHHGSPRSPRQQSARSRVSSAVSERSRPQTSMSQLSSMTWTTDKAKEVTYLQFEVEVGFNIPNITLDPSLDLAQTAITEVANAILEATRNIDWLGLHGTENFYSSISQDENVQEMMDSVAGIVQELESTVNKHLFHFSYYNFLWKDDLHGNFKEFIMGEPGMFNIKKEVERFLYIEKKVLSIPKVLPVGCICLGTDPIKDALHGFAMAWKIQFASVLHEEAKKKLDSAVLYRLNVRNRLELHVQSLDQLNSALQLLEELRDMENKVDSIYLPIETMYEKLREFELRLPRNEVEEVDQLRDKWVELMELAEQVRENLLKERRGAFEQELDKNVKAFVVEVMEFRNAFDSQGPNAPNTPPAKAVASLQEFQQKYKLYDSKRNTLVSVSKLFGIVCKPFPELDKTGEELDLLSQLYGLFQKFIRFDTRFRDTLWADVDLDAAFIEVEGYWDECLALPSKLKDWDAYHDLKTSLQNYLEVFPLLRKLNSKEIRNRHWLDVMNVTGVKFQLEANVFKLSHLLDIGLIKHKADIEEICLSASRELELEIKQRVTEDEWNEQMLTFEHYKNRGPMFLDKVSTERLLEQLEDAQALLASMLTSKYIAPLRDDTALWAKKLKDVTEVLELWLQVQDLWQYLEAVFSNSVTAKELQLEAKRFARTDKSWTKMMKTTYFEMRGVLQCCTGDEVPKVNLLRNMQQELEICFKSLMEYLDNKRRAFPRFYFVSDPVLLAMLSRPNDLESVRPHLKSIFSAIYDVKLEEADTGVDEPTDEIGFAQSRTGTQSRGNRSTSVLSPGLRSNTPPKIDKRLTEIYTPEHSRRQSQTPDESRRYNITPRPRASSSLGLPTRPRASSILRLHSSQGMYWTESVLSPSVLGGDPSTKQKEEESSDEKQKASKLHKQEKESTKKRVRSKMSGIKGVNFSQYSVNPSAMAHGPAYLPSEGIIKDVIIRDAVSVSSSDGEMVLLHEKVCLNDGVEVWLQRLRDSVAKTLRELNISIIQDCNNGVMMDEWASKYPAQVCRIGMLYYWTRECDAGIGELKYDRKALQHNTMKKYQASTAKLTTVLTKGAWRTLEDPMLPLHKARLESMIAQSLYLRDVLENMCNRKSLREPTDFEWRRCIRCYFHPVEDKHEPLIWILDTPYFYGNEFYGTNAGVALTPVTERCFLTMSQALNNYQGSCVSGPVGVGKTETVKGLANVLGHYIGTFQCSSESDTSAMGKIVQGTAMDGCWCCFDEVQSLNRQAMAVLLDQMTAVINALRSRQPYATLSDGQEVSIKKTFAVHMTYNKEATPPGCNLPIDVRSLFRMVSLVKPDFSLILKAKCAAMGFRAPTVLGARLKALAQLAKDELPPECHHHFSVATLVGVLKRATQKRKFIRDEKSVDRLEAKDRETSRSDSQASEAPSKVANPQQSVTVAASGIKMSTGGINRKSGTPNPLTMAGKLEHALVAQTIKEIIGPRFTDQNMKIFKHILDDVFAGLPDPPAVHQIPSARTRGFDVELILKQKSVEKGLVAHEPWIERCKQLYNISKVHHGVIVAGPPGSGKSSCIQTLVDALSLSNQAGTSRQSQGSRTTGNIQENQHKLIKINPMVVDDCQLMFGYLNVNNDWVDGIFTSACRKANRNQSTTWLCLDGPLNPGWADNFNPILNGDKVLHLKNGDKMFLSDNIIVIFETDDLSSASPASVSRSGIVYIDKDILGWKPIADAWLESRTPQEIHNVPHHKFTRVLQRAFAKTLDPISQFVLNEARPRLSLSLVGMFKTCLGLLSSMLANNNEIGGELHIERLYLFCLIWTFGGLLDSVDRKSFSDILKNLSNALPDDDRDICVFDYYVDESGEWDPWTSKLPEAVYSDNQDMLGEVFVPSVDTIRTRNLMEFASFSGLNVLLVGANGSGKTKLIEEFIDYMERSDPQAAVWKRLVFSGASSAKQLQSFLESNIYHRQGFVYGAKDKKKLKVFIDDVNLPVPDEYDVQRCNELLRQLLDDKILCKLQKPFEMKTVEGLSIISAMSMSEQASVSSRQLSDRLLRHFAVFNLPTPQDEAMKSIVHGILDVNMTDGDRPGLDIDLHNSLVKASCELLKALQNVLRPSPMRGRRHYLFTLKDITTCFQCLKRLPEESRADETLIPVISLWRHEMHRIIRDRLSRTSDLIWFDTTIQEIMDQAWPNLKDPFMEYFVTFPTDARLYQRPVTSVGTKHIKVVLQPIENLRDVHSCLNTHLTRYNEEFGNVRLDVMLSDFIISHIIRMHRVLSFHHGGNMLVIGAVGSHLATLCKLALHVADVPIHKMDTSKRSNFFDGLRSAVRLCGSEGKILSLMFTARDLEDPVYLDAINSLLISGEYPHLFTNDEMEGLLQAIGPSMKREFPSLAVDPMKFFVARVKSNLHILMCLQPMNNLLKISASQYPGLLSGCAINWMCDWPQEALLGEASYFITRYQLTEEFENLSDKVTSCLANIHSFVLRDCAQLPWAGDLSEEININQVKVEKKKDQQIVKFLPAKVPNLPYSKVILQERIKLQHRSDDMKAKNETYVGPTTYRRFMETFKFLYNLKSQERTETVDQLKRVLNTLDQTRHDVKIMKKAIKTITTKFEDAKKTTSNLMRQLTSKATALEKLKSRVTQGTDLEAHMKLYMTESEDEEEEELLLQEEYDDYDKEFDKMREAKLKNRQAVAKEEYAQAQKQVEECRQNLEYARQQVLIWKGKVDRASIERLRGFGNPPVLVGQVMEMVMILIGKRLPSQRLYEARELTGKEEMSSRMSSSSSSTRIGVKKESQYGYDRKKSARSSAGTVLQGKKDAGDKFDRAQWKAMQQTMSDTTKFVDMLHNVSWEDGLSEDVRKAVESYLAVSREGQLGITGEGTLLDNAQDTTFAAKKRTPSPDGTKGITIASAKYSSEDCATLVQYTIAIVEYTRLCGPLKVALEKLHELEREIEENERQQKENQEQRLRRSEMTPSPQPKVKEDRTPTPEPEPDYTEADLPSLQDTVNSLQQQFDQSVVEKHSLEMELQSMNERLKAATEMVDSLKPQEASWRKHVKENDCNELMLANCLSAAAFLAYCGPANIDVRNRMGEFFMQVCEFHGLPMPRNKLFRNMELIDFLYKPMDVIKMETMRLSTTKLMLENACFLMQSDSMVAWPLICDPTSRVLDWLRSFYGDTGLVEVKYSEIRSQFENCLAEGCPLLVTDCDTKQLAKDKRFRDAIQSCKHFINGKAKFKITVEDHEVECDPRFRLFLHTTVEPHIVPPHLAAYTSVIYFQRSRSDIEETLLDRFIYQEKSKLQEERVSLLQERKENLELMEKLEKSMLESLSSDIRLMNELPATKKLAELKKQYDETLDSQERVESNEATNTRNRELSREFARRGAVCFHVMQYMREVNPLYQVSYAQFEQLYDAAIAHSERAQRAEETLEKITYMAYTTFARGLLERDRFIFTLLLAIEVEDSLGNIGPGEREFLVSPNYSSVVMTKLGYTQPPDSKIVQMKKPFDWMHDDQFHNLQVLATHFEWFQEKFERMPKDGREMEWRMLCDNVEKEPENMPLPDKMDSKDFAPMKRLLVVRAVRSDRLMQASTVFIQRVLGKNFPQGPEQEFLGYYGDMGLDLSAMYKQSATVPPSTLSLPILLLYSFEAEAAQSRFIDFSNRKQAQRHMITVTDNSQATRSKVRKVIRKAVSEGSWVYIHHAHNAPNVLNSLESFLAEKPNPEGFRVWVASQADPNVIPVRLLQNSIKAVVDTPKVMKDSMIRSFSWFEPDILRQSSRPEWPVMLHNLCYLHAAIQLRARFGQGGWNCPQDFYSIGYNCLQEALAIVQTEFKEPLNCVAPDGSQMPRPVSYNGIRYMVAEIVYGSYVTDFYDQQSLCAMVDFWLSSGALKRDFEVKGLKYRHPQAFFNSNVRLNTLIQALDGAPNHNLDVPEGCHIHQTVVSKRKTLLGDDQYVFTRLNKVFDSMPSTNTLSHKMFPRPPTPFDGPAQAGISKTSNNPSVVHQGVFSTASYATHKIRFKDVELWQICNDLLQKTPKIGNSSKSFREFVVEKIRKLPGDYPIFNDFIMKECEILHQLLTEVRHTLTLIRNACENNVMGDQLSDHYLSAADDLYHLRIPRIWCKMTGTTAPPYTYNAAQWLRDLEDRWKHFEKILSMGRKAMPAYWLGAFFNPRGLLALLKQEAIKSYCGDRSGNFEQFTFQTDTTFRDFGHLLQPPPEGVYIHGIHLWGCSIEKTTNEFQDQASRQGYAPLPVLHLQCYPINEKPALQEPSFQCPLYPSRIAPRDPIMEIDIKKEGIPPMRWALRGLTATIWPY